MTTVVTTSCLIDSDTQDRFVILLTINKGEDSIVRRLRSESLKGYILYIDLGGCRWGGLNLTSYLIFCTNLTSYLFFPNLT